MSKTTGSSTSTSLTLPSDWTEICVGRVLSEDSGTVASTQSASSLIIRERIKTYRSYYLFEIFNTVDPSESNNNTRIQLKISGDKSKISINKVTTNSTSTMNIHVSVLYRR